MPYRPGRVGQGGGNPAARTVLFLCGAVMVMDGFDLVIYGTVLPSLLDYRPWQMTPESGGAIASYALIGLMTGALVSGYIGDQFGRRKPIIAYTALFSLLTGLCAAAPNPAVLGVLRFLVGLVLGGAMPMTVALVAEYAPQGRRNFFNAATLSGYAIGGIAVAAAGIVVIPALGFRAMFVLGAVLGLLLVPVLVRKLPESIVYLLASGRREDAERVAERVGIVLSDVERGAAGKPVRQDRLVAIRVMVSRGHRLASIALPLGGLCIFVLTYGMNTWLPAILRQSGYSLGSSLAFLMALSVGNLLGNLLLSQVADRIGTRTTIALGCVCACVCILLLTAGFPGPVVYMLILAAGFGGLTSGALIFSATATFYPALARGTALGWTMGVSRFGGFAGPLIVGFLIGAGVSPNWTFYFFGATALAACVFTVLVPRSAAERQPQPSVAESR